MLNPVTFYLRKVLFVASIIFFDDFVWGQLALILFFSVRMIILIQWYQPYSTKYSNRLETFNEVCILCLTYIAMCYTDFVPDPIVRYEFGLCYIGMNGFMILVHVTLILISTSKRVQSLFKKYWNKCVNKVKKFRCTL